jgi:hypothetical protein
MKLDMKLIAARHYRADCVNPDPVRASKKTAKIVFAPGFNEQDGVTRTTKAVHIVLQNGSIVHPAS